MAFKARGGKFNDFPNKKPLMRTLEVIQSHLAGANTIGIYPLLVDNTSHFIVADFDKENWRKESVNFLKVCKEYKIPACIERSRSGSGSHIWVFFEEKYPAQKSRTILLELIRKALNLSEFEKEVGFDRLFPNQDYHSGQGFGNLIALPFQGLSNKKGNTVFLDPETFEIIPDQWEYLRTIQKLSKNQLDELYNSLVEPNFTQIEKTKSKSKIKSNALNIVLRNHVGIKKSDLTPLLVKYLRENLNFFNTEYLIKKRIGVSTYQTEKYFKLITETTEFVHIPRGFLPQLIDFCREHEMPYVIIDERNRKSQIEFNSKITLYDYQKQTIKEIEGNDFGVIVAPSGSGKTIIGLELIVQKSQPALILVHRKQLLDQWIERIQSFLGIPKNQIGQISGGKKIIGKQITVAMMQSLTKIKDLYKFADQFGIVIVDECHHIPAKTFRELIVQFNPYYLYGLTATPKRKYNDEKLIYFYIGEILLEINPDLKSSSLNSQDVMLSIKKTSLEAPFDYKTDTFEVLSKILIYDSARNQMIIDDVLKQIQDGRKVLVLTERKEHVEVLNLYLKSKCEVITLTGEDSASKRKLKLEQISLGHFQVLVVTGQLFGEGIDLASLNCLFLIYPFSFEGKLTQYIGRIQRSKKNQVIYDYHDPHVKYFDKLFKKRQTYYRKRGWMS